MNADWRNRYEVALDAALEAGRFALQHFDRDVSVEWKADSTPVTLADRGAEKLLRETLLGRFPRDGFLGEESGAADGDSGYRWIIDPVDGTRNFVRGIPIWATLVGLEHRGELIAGVCHVPAWNQTFRALRGDGAFRDQHRLHVSSVDKLAEAHLFYSSIGWFSRAGCEAQFLQLARQTRHQRGFGDFYGFVLVAQGSGELMIEHGIHAWDIAAIVPIIEEAGGKTSNWDGRFSLERPDILVSNGRVHEAALAIMTGGPGG